jgi:iron(III) transport system substrate-binding protein
MRFQTLVVLGIAMFFAVAPRTSGERAAAAGRSAKSLTVYSGRSEELVGPIIERFGRETGVKVRMRYGGTSELAATLLEEGERSPADVFFAQDPAGIGAVRSLLAELPDGILGRVEPRFRSPDRRWVGISGRARVVAYSTRLLSEADLPDDLWGFTDSRWKGRIGWPPTNGSFQAMVTAMRVLWGEEKMWRWVEGVAGNDPKVFPNNTTILEALGTGEVEVGFVNHYYLFRFLGERGESFPVRNYHPRAGGPGALILVAGAGILRTAGNREEAVRFLEYLLSPEAQQYFTGRTFEYPVIQGISTHRLLPPLSRIMSPEVDLADLSDLRGTLDLLRSTGVLP